ncbi:MAG: metal ABC transporter permease, partial [Terrimicrobiaceae bacterium]|nr:metal ABC transporter permease [Terrimicrobiaceae bacterium]
MRSLLCAAAFCAALAPIAGAAQPSQLATPKPWAARAADFLMLRDTAVRWPAAGSVLLGVGCGIMGCFLLVRKFAMLGDALSHAVLPGV